MRHSQWQPNDSSCMASVAIIVGLTDVVELVLKNSYFREKTYNVAQCLSAGNVAGNVLVSKQSRAVPMPNLCPTSAASDT